MSNFWYCSLRIDYHELAVDSDICVQSCTNPPSLARPGYLTSKEDKDLYMRRDGKSGKLITLELD